MAVSRSSRQDAVENARRLRNAVLAAAALAACFTADSDDDDTHTHTHACIYIYGPGQGSGLANVQQTDIDLVSCLICFLKSESPKL